MAKNMGNGDWSGTGECVPLAGKGRITDIFAGSEDASVLVLGGEGDGCALFLEDVYSAAKGGAEQARLFRVDTIVATNGNDIIDLTSQIFGFSGGVTVKGGDGDDVIWANSGENMLYGGDGDDCIVGGSGNDTIIGGSGNDTLHGGGGQDAFCFCPGWGTDSVTQLDGGTVELWFDGIQRSDLTLSADGEGHALFSMDANEITLDTVQFSAIQEAWLAGAEALSDTLFVKFKDGSPAGAVPACLASAPN